MSSWRRHAKAALCVLLLQLMLQLLLVLLLLLLLLLVLLLLLLLDVRILDLLLLHQLATVLSSAESLGRHLVDFSYFTHHLLHRLEADYVTVTAARKELSLVSDRAALCRRLAVF
jgi:hypothetical protein